MKNEVKIYPIRGMEDQTIKQLQLLKINLGLNSISEVIKYLVKSYKGSEK